MKPITVECLVINCSSVEPRRHFGFLAAKPPFIIKVLETGMLVTTIPNPESQDNQRLRDTVGSSRFPFSLLRSGSRWRLSPSSKDGSLSSTVEILMQTHRGYK